MNNVLGLKQPCQRECPDRKLGCHSSCEKYIKFRKELDVLKNKEKTRINNIIVSNELSKRRYK